MVTVGGSRLINNVALVTIRFRAHWFNLEPLTEGQPTNHRSAFEFEERLKKKEQNGEPTLGLRPPRVADDETFVSDSWTLVTILLPFLLLRFLRNLTYHLHHLHHSVPSDQNFLFFYWSSTTQGDQTEKSLRRWS